MPKETVMLSELEIQILGAFIQHLYLTDNEMASILRTLADKLER